MATLGFDPATLRLWRLAEDLATGVRRVQVLLARDAPQWADRGAHWQEHGVHQHAVPTVIACLAGVVRIATARGPIDLAERELCVVAPAAWHSHRPLRPGSAAFGQGFIFGRSDIALQGDGRSLTVLTAEEPSRSLMRALLATSGASQSRRLAAQLIEGFVTNASEAVTVHPAVHRMGFRMWAGLDHHLSVAEVLAASGLGARQAHRLFVAWFGMPPARAILTQRLGLAEELLREGASVGEAARACGFADRRSFTRAWRRVHGAPPSQRSS
jgi:AraC-like DNA-binding protein